MARLHLDKVNQMEDFDRKIQECRWAIQNLPPFAPGAGTMSRLLRLIVELRAEVKRLNERIEELT